MINNYIRNDLKDYKPYHAPYKAYDIKIDANENPFSHSEEVISKVKAWLDNKDNITRYPDTDSNALRDKIAKLYHLSKDNVICGVGSDQLIEYIVKLFIEPGDCILVPNPSFSMYGLSNALNHGKTYTYELEEDFSYSVDKIIELYKEKQPKIVFICSPNNPTGSTIAKDSIEQILKEVKCPVVIDEAYTEFVTESMVDKIKDYNNLIVLRTFSKAFGLAGLRVGYGLASKEMIEAINICKSPYNLSSFSQAFAGFILDDAPYYRRLANDINQNRDALFNDLKEIECIEKIYPSQANFILVKVKDLDIAPYLEENRILVRAYGTEGRLGYCIRLSVGTKEENRKLIEVLKKYN